jgi:hypothetical protein
MEKVTFDNFKQHLNKRVEVEICCYEGGMMYPDDNVLIGMNQENFYFYSKEDDVYWHWKATDDTGDKHSQLNCSISVWAKPIEETKESKENKAWEAFRDAVYDASPREYCNCKEKKPMFDSEPEFCGGCGNQIIKDSDS